MSYWYVHVFLDFAYYYLVYRVVFHAQFYKKWWVIMGTLAGACVLLFALTRIHLESGAIFPLILVELAAIVILAKEERGKVFIMFPIVYIFSGFCSVVSTYLFSFMYRIPYIEFLDSEFWTAFAEVSCIAVFAAVLICDKQRTEKMIAVTVTKYLMVLTGLGCMFFIVAFSQSIVKGQRADIFDLGQYAAIGCIILGMLFVALLCWQQILERKNVEYREKNEYYQRFMIKQEAHINDIIESDKAMRRLRHDLRAHISALEAGIASGDLQMLEQYVKRMRQAETEAEVYRFTGIAALDAVISEWYDRAKEKDIAWKWSGMLGQEGRIQIFDLCIIFSNLLSNAVEAAEKMNEGSTRRIEVWLGSLQDCTVIRVRNTYDEAKKGPKEDAKNHGFGLENVRRIVTKCNGRISIEEKDGVFAVEIIL